MPDAGASVELWHLPAPLAAAARQARDAAAVAAVPSLNLPARDPARAPTPSAPGAFRPIADEIRDLERARMVAALRASAGVQNRAADLIEMPLRTFVTKLKRYAIAPAEWA